MAITTFTPWVRPATACGARPIVRMASLQLVGIARYSSLVAPRPAPNVSYSTARSTAVSRLNGNRHQLRINLAASKPTATAPTLTHLCSAFDIAENQFDKPPKLAIIRGLTPSAGAVMSVKLYSALCAVALLVLLGACGKKGDLVLPPVGPTATTTPSHAP